jgi:L-fuconolactonase
MIVDAHHHVWDPAARRHPWLDDLPELRRPFLLADYAEAAEAEGVTASVLVQVLASTAETEEFLALTARTAAEAGPAGTSGTSGTSGTAEGEAAGPVPPVVAGVVGWADLTRDDIGDELARLRALPGGDRLAGIRHLVHDEPDPGWLARPDVRRGLRAVGAAGLVFDVLVRPAQLPAALRVAGQLDDVRFVLDHGGKPEIGAGRTEPWAGLIGELASRPNVTCKLSGLVTEAGTDWKKENFEPYVDQLLESFGPGRLMFGSDWPVCTLAASYHEVITLAAALLTGQLSNAELDGVFGANAVAAYGLSQT